MPVHLGCSQLQRLTPTAVAELLPQVLPQAWYKQELVTWDLQDTNINIPETWLPQVRINRYMFCFSFR